MDGAARPSWLKISEMRKNYISSLQNHFVTMQQKIMPDVDLIFKYEKGWDGEKDLLSALSEKQY